MNRMLPAALALATLASVGSAHAETEPECERRMDFASPEDHRVNQDTCHKLYAAPIVPQASTASTEADVYTCVKSGGTFNDTVIAQCRARVQMYDDLAQAIPQWSQINNSAAFAQWLDAIDPIARSTRRSALNYAHNTNNTAQIIAIFNAFIRASTTAQKPTVYAPDVNSAPMPSASAPVSTNGIVVALSNIDRIANIQTAKITMGDGSVTYRMTVDTGASNMSISKALADWLLSTGHATFICNSDSTIADGRTVVNRLIKIDHIEIDGHAVDNVTADDGAPDPENWFDAVGYRRAETLRQVHH